MKVYYQPYQNYQNKSYQNAYQIEDAVRKIIAFFILKDQKHFFQTFPGWKSDQTFLHNFPNSVGTR